MEAHGDEDGAGGPGGDAGALKRGIMKRIGRIKNGIKRKLASRAGESFAESLVALLISSFAMAMLAGAMMSSLGVITKTRKKLEAYYARAERMVTRDEAGTPATVTISGNGISVTAEVTFYENKEFGRNPVISYRTAGETGEAPGGGEESGS